MNHSWLILIHGAGYAKITRFHPISCISPQLSPPNILHIWGISASRVIIQVILPKINLMHLHFLLMPLIWSFQFALCMILQSSKQNKWISFFQSLFLCTFCSILLYNYLNTDKMNHCITHDITLHTWFIQHDLAALTLHYINHLKNSICTYSPKQKKWEMCRK